LVHLSDIQNRQHFALGIGHFVGDKALITVATAAHGDPAVGGGQCLRGGIDDVLGAVADVDEVGAIGRRLALHIAQRPAQVETFLQR
jgi:hypothetical protein